MIQYWFATPIYYNLIDGIDNNLLVKRAYELKEKYNGQVASIWRCNTFNTLGRGVFLGDNTDNVIRDLTRTIEGHVELFASNIGINMNNKKAKTTELWFNISSAGAFQEYHSHQNSHFSAVYFPKTHSIDTGQLIFHSLVNQFDCFNFNEFNKKHEGPDIISGHVSYNPLEGQLIIFRSYLPHSVEVNKTQEDRISMSFNFDLVTV